MGVHLASELCKLQTDKINLRKSATQSITEEWMSVHFLSLYVHKNLKWEVSKSKVVKKVVTVGDL